MNIFVKSVNAERLARFGCYLLVSGTAMAGVLDLIWGEFDASHQPFGALGDHIPGVKIFAYITAVWMMSAGLAVLWKPTARAASLATAIIYLVFALFWLPRFFTVPRIYGFRPAVFVGLTGLMFNQLIVVAGALIVHASFAPRGSPWPERLAVVSRWVFGLGPVLFGFSHFGASQVITPMIPKWMPLGAIFWVFASGIGFLLAGLSILSGILNALAARLLGLMLVIFEIALVPLIFAHPHVHIVWGATAYNLAAAGAAWIYAASAEIRHAKPKHDLNSQFAEVA